MKKPAFIAFLLAAFGLRAAIFQNSFTTNANPNTFFGAISAGFIGVTPTNQPGILTISNGALIRMDYKVGTAEIGLIKSPYGGQDWKHIYVEGCPTNSINGKYTFQYFTNDPSAINAAIFTNSTATWRIWIIDSQNSLAYADDYQILPFNVPIYNSSVDAGPTGWVTNVAFAAHNEETFQPVAAGGQGIFVQYQNGVQGKNFTNMATYFGTNFMTISMSSLNPGTYYGGYMRAEGAIINNFQPVVNQKFTNTTGNLQILGEYFMSSTVASKAEVDFYVAEYTTTANGNPWIANVLSTNIYHAALPAGVIENAVIPFNYPIAPLAVYWWQTNLNGTGALSYPTNCRSHN